MTSLILAAGFFLGIHLFVAGTAVRDRLIARLGAGPYRGLFSLASLAGLIWMGMAYNDAPMVVLWGKLGGLKPAALAGMVIAFAFVVLGLTKPNPTGVGGEALIAQARGPVGIQRITRHPFLWGVALWALIHLAVKGDLASLVLFGSLLVLALCGTVSIDRKRRRALGAAWDGFAAQTSNLPFLAIAQGRGGLRLGEHKAWEWLVVAAAFLVTAALHRTVFGVSPLLG
ncbi:MAG: NnrU family protein [Proteobacteria bacterium]|nr:NnrU family protein [Pseudomonadota bacterium]